MSNYSKEFIYQKGDVKLNDSYEVLKYFSEIGID